MNYSELCFENRIRWYFYEQTEDQILRDPQILTRWIWQYDIKETVGYSNVLVYIGIVPKMDIKNSNKSKKKLKIQTIKDNISNLILLTWAAVVPVAK